MVYKRLILLSLVVLPIGLSAQTAEDYFHGGAQYYVFGQKEKAQTTVVTGLTKFPDDPRLNELAVLLKKEEQQQQQQQQQQQDKQQSQNDQPKDSQPQQNQVQSQKENEQKQPKPGESPDKKDPPQQQNAGSSQQDKKEQESGEQPESAQYAEGQMTPQQAKQLLDAQKGDEKLLPVGQNKKAPVRERSFKDW